MRRPGPELPGWGPLWLWAMALACLLAWAPGLAQANTQDLVVERAWVDDPGGLLTWEEVQLRPARPVRDVLSAGYSPQPLWLKLRIDPTVDGLPPDSRLVLRIRPAYLDRITLFDPLQTPAQRPSVGDRQPISNNAEPGTTFTFHLPAGAAARDLWLRLQTNSARLVYAEVMTQPAYELSTVRLQNLGALYMGLIAVFFLWGLMHVLLRPEPLVLAFLLYQTGALAVGACLWGYSHLYLSDWLGGPAVDLMTSLVIIAASGSAILFSHFVLHEYSPSRWRDRIMYGMLAIYPLLMMALQFGHTSRVLQVNMLLILLVPLVLWVLALVPPARRSHERRARPRGLSKRVVVGYFSVTLLFTLLTAAPALGLVQGAEISIYIVFLYSVSSGVLMVLMLQYRAWQNAKGQEFLRLQAQEADTRAQQERTHREERERLLAMLGHELKTPLATMRMLIADRSVPHALANRVNSSVIEMGHVVERAVQAVQIEAGRITPTFTRIHLPYLVDSVLEELPGPGRVDVRCIDDSPPWVWTDAILMKVVVRNLLDNALKYSPPEARVDVVLGPSGDEGAWWFTVCNPPGRAGLPDPDRVFEKYYRSPKATHRSGSGLGLYLVQGLVKVMDGQLTFDVVDGHARFAVSMPPLRKVAEQ